MCRMKIITNKQIFVAAVFSVLSFILILTIRNNSTNFRHVYKDWNHLKTDQNNITFNLNRSLAMRSKFQFRVPSVNCASLFTKNGSQTDLSNLTETLRLNLDIESFLETSRNSSQYCELFKEERRFITEPLTQEEADFPIAYSIMVFKDVELFERLLRAVYRPQHYYCIHIDLSSEKVVHEAVRAITRCFDNVFVAKNLIDVEYRKFSSLAADLLCMRQLLSYVKWKYFINLTAQEFPLQTSIAIVRVLKAFNGANSVEATIKQRNMERYKAAPPLRVNVTLTKGSVHIVASRAYVDYVINNATAVEFLEWVKHVGDPDETFFSTLNHSPQLEVPGAYTGWPESFTKEYPFIARFKNWVPPSPSNFACAGKWVRAICIFGVGDLPLLAERPELFANKFNIDFEPVAYGCMEELIANRTLDELTGRYNFSAADYKELSFVKHHV